jgi:hypothetical protein
MRVIVAYHITFAQGRISWLQEQDVRALLRRAVRNGQRDGRSCATASIVTSTRVSSNATNPAIRCDSRSGLA